jgi:hypothetical protein
MSLLDKLTVGSDVEGTNEDYIPGAGGFTLDTGVYPMKVELAYLGESQKGALSVTLWLKEVNGNKSLRETFYVTSSKANGQKNTFMDKRSGKPRLLPGMENMNQLAMICTGQPLAAQKSEPKTVKLYDFDEKKELPKEVPVLTGMLQKDVLVCVVKHRKNKTQYIGGEYVETNEEKIFNEVDKFLHASGHSVAEKAGGGDADFRERWEAKRPADFVMDKYKPVGGSAVADASNAAAADNSAEVDSLFGDDTAEAA